MENANLVMKRRPVLFSPKKRVSQTLAARENDTFSPRNWARIPGLPFQQETHFTVLPSMPVGKHISLPFPSPLSPHPRLPATSLPAPRPSNTGSPRNTKRYHT